MDSLPTCEAKVCHFYQTVHTLLDTYLPVHYTFRHTNDKPWVTDSFRRLIRQRQHAFITKDLAKYHRLRNLTNRAASKLRRTFYRKQIEGLRKSEPSKWWCETKRLTGQDNNSDANSSLMGLANKLTNGNLAQLAQTINTSLQQVSDDLTPLTDQDLLPNADFLQYMEIQPYEIFFKLNSIKIRKAPGPDDIPNWMLRDFAGILCHPLCTIFNDSIKETYVPAVWKQANVIPLPKVRPPQSIESDLRPISLTPTISKILEAIVGQHILRKFRDKLDPKQFGAVKGRSTVHALIDLLHTWHSALDKGNSARIVFIDYAKAFDHVDHRTILKTLNSFGVEPILINWSHAFLNSRQQRVKLDKNTFSDWITLKGGLPQGTWLGPLFFIGLINDLETFLPLHKFVDDVTITEILESCELSSRMQDACNEVEEWSEAHSMNINPKKTKQMILGSMAGKLPSNLSISSLSIEIVDQFKLLGVIITDDLKWDEHVNSICSRINQRLFFLRKLKRAAMSMDDLVTYYCTVIRPVAEYACAVWHTGLTDGQSEQLEHLHRRALKIIFGKKLDLKSACIIYGIEPTLASRREIQTQRLFKQLQNSAHCLHHLLPDKRDPEIIARLRNARPYEPPFARTCRFQNSFLIFSLNHYQ
jgi:hypothetical protein